MCRRSQVGPARPPHLERNADRRRTPYCICQSNRDSHDLRGSTLHGELLHELESTAESDRLRIAEPSAEQAAQGNVDVSGLQIRSGEVERRRGYLSRRRKADERHLNGIGGARNGRCTYNHGRKSGDLA